MINREERIYNNVPKDLQDIARVVRLMDSSIRIPFLNRTIGIEPIIGMVPVLGDFIGFIISGWIMITLLRNNGSGKVIAKMSLNIIIDVLLTFIPVLGNVMDFFFKTNQRNLELALDHYQYGKNQGSAWSVIIPVMLILALIFSLFITVTIFLIYLLVTGIQTLF